METLLRLSGRAHIVYTALALVQNGVEEPLLVNTDFADATDDLAAVDGWSKRINSAGGMEEKFGSGSPMTW